VSGALVTPEQAQTFERCMGVGGVAVFPGDTAYDVACDPGRPAAIERLDRLTGRRPGTPAAVLFFALDLARAALPEQGPRTLAALESLLPGAMTVLLDNPAERHPLACGRDPATLALRVPALPPALEALEAVRWPVLTTPAGAPGAPGPRHLHEVPPALREHADLVLDGGALPGTHPTIVDLRGFELEGTWAVLREGAVPAGEVTGRLAA
jgi:L-threonylcarbamoyladenylate synthase